MHRPFNLTNFTPYNLTSAISGRVNLVDLILTYIKLRFLKTIPLSFTLFCFILLCLPLIGCKTNARHIPVPTPTQSRSAALSFIEIGITTHLGDQQRFVRGDDISFLVNLNKDAYLLILFHDASNQLWQLVPNDYNQHNFFKAGDYLSIPNESLPYKFIASPPFGKETIFAFASDQPFPSFNYSLTKNGMILIDANIETVLETLHDKAKGNRSAFGEAKLTIITQEQLL